MRSRFLLQPQLLHVAKEVNPVRRVQPTDAPVDDGGPAVRVKKQERQLLAEDLPHLAVEAIRCFRAYLTVRGFKEPNELGANVGVRLLEVATSPSISPEFTAAENCSRS